MMSGSDIDGRAKTACGWVTDIRRTDGIEGDEVKPGHKTVYEGLFRIEMDSDNATSVRPQTQAMGAAHRDPGRGEILMRFDDHKPFMLLHNLP